MRPVSSHTPGDMHVSKPGIKRDSRDAIFGCCHPGLLLSLRSTQQWLEGGAVSSSLPSIPASRQPSRSLPLPISFFPRNCDSSGSQRIYRAYLQGFLNVSLSCPPCCNPSTGQPITQITDSLCHVCPSCPSSTSFRGLEKGKDLAHSTSVGSTLHVTLW